MSEQYSPNKYAAVLEAVQIETISILDLSAKSFPENIDRPPFNVEIENETEFQFSEKTNDFSGIDRFHLISKQKGQILLELRLSIRAHFTSPVKVDKTFLKLFEQNSLKLFTYPFLRQCVWDVTAKMGLPPLVLPIWKIHRKSKSGVLKHKKSEPIKS